MCNEGFCQGFNDNCAYFHIIVVMLNLCEMYIEIWMPVALHGNFPSS
jgi:hypothetical protein